MLRFGGATIVFTDRFEEKELWALPSVRTPTSCVSLPKEDEQL